MLAMILLRGQIDMNCSLRQGEDNCTPCYLLKYTLLRVPSYRKHYPVTSNCDLMQSLLMEECILMLPTKGMSFFQPRPSSVQTFY
jgi:hypothetical protein